jgi:serine/threonine-protein kinase
MTRTGLVMGTPHYMSPEQVRGEHVDFRSDVFALGCVFYEILTGRRPFDADSIHSVLYKVMQEEPTPVKQLVPSLPSVLQQILEKAMAKAPAHRFKNAEELGEALERAREAIASGLGNEPLPGLGATPAGASAPGSAASGATAPLAPVHPAKPGPAGAGPASRGESHPPAPVGPRRTERSGSRPHSQLRQPADRTLWYVVAVAALLIVGLGSYLLWGPRGSGSGASQAGSDIDSVIKDLAVKRAETAMNRLDAGDYEDALRRAGEALKLDPNQAQAREVERKAGDIKRKVDAALEKARGSGEGPKDEAARQAYWDLLQAAPEHREAGVLAASFDGAFKGEADEARQLMLEAQKSASEHAGAPHLDDFKAAGELAKSGESSLRGGKFAAAARDFMRARDRYRRALTQAGGSPRS